MLHPKIYGKYNSQTIKLTYQYEADDDCDEKLGRYELYAFFFHLLYKNCGPSEDIEQ